MNNSPSSPPYPSPKESSPSSPTQKEEVFGQFFHDLEQAADRDAVLRRFCDDFPHWAADFREEVAFDRILSPPEPPVDQTDQPYPDHLPDFRIIRRIAEGGMGIVYEAEQLSLGRHVALKIRRSQLSSMDTSAPR
mgnify:CR=1 FL=1